MFTDIDLVKFSFENIFLTNRTNKMCFLTLLVYINSHSVPGYRTWWRGLEVTAGQEEAVPQHTVQRPGPVLKYVGSSVDVSKTCRTENQG